MRLDPQIMDDFNPHLVTTKVRKPCVEIKGMKCPIMLKEGKMEPKDLEEL
jgi:hypothetical protein